MVALAAADRPLVRDLLTNGGLDLDYLETTGPLIESATKAFPKQPLLLHNSVWDWSLADPEALDRHEVVPLTLDALGRTRAPWLSIHLGFGASEVFFEGRAMAGSGTLGREELFGNVCRNVRALAAAIPVPLILENLDYNPTGAYEHVCEPEFIAAVLEATGTGLLLDLAHARVSAARFGRPIEDYLDGLPLDRVLQLHVSGPRWHPAEGAAGILRDDHEPLLEEDYDLLEEVLSRTEPRALTLEYGRDAAALKGQLGRLGKVLEARS